MVFTQKSSKKRPAPGQGGPKSKKIHVETRSSKTDGNKQRSKPLTQPLDAQDPDSESEEGGLEDDVDVEEDELDDEEEEKGGDEFAMQVDDSKSAEYKIPKDPNGLSRIKMST